MSLPTDKHSTLFTARMNVTYHEGREQFYAHWLNWTAFVSVVFSSAAFVALGDLLPGAVADYKLAIIGAVAAIVALLNGAVLAFGMQNKLLLHGDLKRRWMGLIERTQLLKGNDSQGLKDILQAIAQLNAHEPPPSQKQLNLAYERTCQAMNLKVHSA